MKKNFDINDKIENTLHAFDDYQSTVKTAPFFKDKMIQRLFSGKEEKATTWNWFTPQLQLATLVCVVIINVYTIQQVRNAKYNEAISSFASDYGIKSESKSSLFNL